MNYQIYNWFSFCFFIALVLMLFYQAYINLILKKITEFGLDKLTLLYIRIFKGDVAYDRGQKLIARDKKRILMLGFIAFMSGLAAMYVAGDIYNKYLLITN